MSDTLSRSDDESTDQSTADDKPIPDMCDPLNWAVIAPLAFGPASLVPLRYGPVVAISVSVIVSTMLIITLYSEPLRSEFPVPLTVVGSQYADWDGESQ